MKVRAHSWALFFFANKTPYLMRKRKECIDMITIEIQSLIVGMICAYAVSRVVKVWNEKYDHVRETKTDTKKAKSNDGKVAEQ